ITSLYARYKEYNINTQNLIKQLRSVGYNVLLTSFLDDRTTAWVLGYFQGDDAAFGEWIVSVLKALGVRPGGGSRIGCGVIGLVE
ncbi:hypothetical protein J4G08_17480, partial [Candidatus Poribacteria bacterium]|nr:hypothetical protein [Candidatus Poribacteria bacterium]